MEKINKDIDFVVVLIKGLRKHQSRKKTVWKHRPKIILGYGKELKN